MIIKTTHEQFDGIVEHPVLHLPIEWEGDDFYERLNYLFNDYIELAESKLHKREVNKLRTICKWILKSVKEYLGGFPNKSYKSFTYIMRKLDKHPLMIYRKTGFNDAFDTIDPLSLYRIRNVWEEREYSRNELFHAPYYVRAKVATSRFSIPGFPSLYLGTSAKLCRFEIQREDEAADTIISRFKLQRNMRNNNGLKIDVMELGIKPQDFIRDHLNRHNNIDSPRRNHLYEINLDSLSIKSSFLYWYPLIAACSFVRNTRGYPFASEYIIPQLLMEWNRSKIERNELVGIRYFSCYSLEASEQGFNYVFPTSGRVNENGYCEILSGAFTLTSPISLDEHRTFEEIEEDLSYRYELDRV